MHTQRQRSKTDLAGFVEGGDDSVEPSSGDNLGKLFFAWPTLSMCIVSHMFSLHFQVDLARRINLKNECR